MKPDFLTFSRIHKAIDYIYSHDLASFPNGKLTIDDDISLNIMEIETKCTNTFEAHRVFIDIHYIISGEEAIDIAPIESIEITEPYSEEKDILFGTGQGERHIIKQGQFCITMPEEAHSPGLAVTSPMKIRKAVFKVRY